MLFLVCLVFGNITVLQHLKLLFVKTKPLSACHAATRCHEKPCLSSRWVCSASPRNRAVVLEWCVLKASHFTIQLMQCLNFLEKLFHSRILLETKVTSDWLNYLLTYPEAAEVEVPKGCWDVACLVTLSTVELKGSVCSNHSCACLQRTDLWFVFL